MREGKLEANAEILGEINNLSQRLSVTKTRELLEKEKKVFILIICEHTMKT